MLISLQNGDEEAFRNLVADYEEIVFNTCLGFLKNTQDADDIAQEVFIEIFQSIHGFRGESSLGTWIYRISVTKSLEMLRKRKQKKRWAYFQALMGKEIDTGNIAGSDSYHPGVSLENKERAAILWSKIEKLPENQRIAFTLHKMEGLSYAEISEIMGVTLSSIESLMFRAKKNLRKSLKKYYETEKD
jgi:RNA polymerase sigma-70 factor (ECF subfamily)